MAETKKGSRKAPRTHQKHWKDNTRNERQNSRSAELNRIAGEAGYYNKKGKPSWSTYETAVINGKTRLTPLAPDGETHLCGGKYYTDKVLGEVCCRCQAPRR